MAREILEILRHRLLLARDGEEAVHQFTAHRNAISLVLLDVIMPKLDGIDAYERIRKAKPGTPVIFTSGYSDHGAVLASLTEKGATVPAETVWVKDPGAKSAESFSMRPRF